jgi:uncharacterized membrane protein YqhA
MTDIDLLELIVLANIMLIFLLFALYNFFISRIQKQFFKMLEELSAGQEYELNEIKKRLEKIEKIENFVKILEKYIEDNKKAGK